MAKQGVINEIVTPSVGKELDAILNQLDLIHSGIQKVNATKINLPSQSRQASGNSAQVNAQINRSLSEQEKLTVRLSAAKQKEAIETAKLRIQLSEVTKENKKQAQEVLGVIDAYGKLNNELNTLRLQAKNVAADMFLLEQAGRQNSEEYQKLASTYGTLEKRVNLLDGGLKKIDSGLGQNQRFVGEYTRQWNGLGNAINQLTREAPAFAVSLNTGFLAISNNLPILVDEINNLTRANKELAAQGKPTTSVIKQIASSLFSWQTAIVAGITVLSAYGTEIGKWVKSLFTAEKAINAVKQAQTDLNTIRLKSQKDILDEITSYKLYLSTARDETKSLEERQIAVKKLQDEYAFYFGKLTEQQVLAGDTAEAEREINKALEARSNVAGISDAYNKNQAKILDVERAIGEANKTISAEYIRQNNLRKQASATGKVVEGAIEESQKRYAAASASLEKLTPQLLELEKAQQLLIAAGIKYKKEAIGLEFQPETEDKQKELQIADIVDYEASRYELLRTRLENEITINQEIFENEEINLEKRRAAEVQYRQKQSELANATRDEQLRLIKKTTDDEIAELQRRAKEGEISERNANQAIYALNKQATFDNAKVYEDYAETLRLINKGIEENMKGVADAINFKKADILIDERDLRNTTEYTAKIQELVKANSDFRDIEKAGKDFALANRDITTARIQKEIDALEKEKIGLKDTEANVQKRLELEDELLKKRKDLADVTKQKADEEAAAIIKLQKATESYLNTLADSALGELGFSSLNMFTQIEENGKTMFENLMAGANTTAEQFGVAFNAITEVAQQTFAFLNQNQQAYFDSQYDTLKRAYFALPFLVLAL